MIHGMPLAIAAGNLGAGRKKQVRHCLHAKQTLERDTKLAPRTLVPNTRCACALTCAFPNLVRTTSWTSALGFNCMSREVGDNSLRLAGAAVTAGFVFLLLLMLIAMLACFVAGDEIKAGAVWATVHHSADVAEVGVVLAAGEGELTTPLLHT